MATGGEPRTAIQPRIIRLPDIMKAVTAVFLLALTAPAIRTLPAAHGPFGEFLSGVFGLTLILLVILLGSMTFTLIAHALHAK